MTRRLVLQNALSDRVRVAGFELLEIEVKESSPALSAAIDEISAALRRRFVDPPAATTWTEPARRLYRSLGIDPSRRRPSSEALLRRILQGKGLYTVNTAVDSANLASLQVALPVGLYDLDRIVAPDSKVLLRLGNPGEFYAGIRKDDIHVADRPTLVDAEGAFGNPSSDSARTEVSLGTRALLFVVYAPKETEEAFLETIGRAARDTMLAHVGGRCPEVWIA